MTKIIRPIAQARALVEADPTGVLYVRLLLRDAGGEPISLRVDDPAVLRELAQGAMASGATLVRQRAHQAEAAALAAAGVKP